MITFREKEFSEYDAMRSLYVELNKYNKKVELIDKSALIPVLKGNNVVIERFVISTNFFGKDRYRMYLKIGAKAKMPDSVRLPHKSYDRKIGNISLEYNPSINPPYIREDLNSDSLEASNGSEQKLFAKGNNKPPKIASGKISTGYELKQTVQKLIGDAILYDKSSRSLVLEFDSIQDAINSLDILPFGVNYKLYLLS
jgi:hypothetical protein